MDFFSNNFLNTMSDRINKTFLTIQRDAKERVFVEKILFLQKMYLKNLKEYSIEYDKFVIMATLLQLTDNEENFVAEILNTLNLKPKFLRLFHKIGYVKNNGSYKFEVITGQGFNIQKWYKEYKKSDFRGLYYLLAKKIDKLDAYFVFIGIENFCNLIADYELRNAIIKNRRRLDLVKIYEIVLERALHDMCFDRIENFIIFLCGLSHNIKRLEEERRSMYTMRNINYGF